eukprot:Seg8953.4 transcript_id=Seg8953.4/GoldUCD/mRNA.D3Y31 product="hypothetical protein" protein_id=Seg8953.4/GoldUCD/D3Y31
MGRPPRGEDRKIVYLNSSIFDRWKMMKCRFGMDKNTNSEFASILLDRMEQPCAVSSQGNEIEKNTAVTPRTVCSKGIRPENDMAFSTPMNPKKKIAFVGDVSAIEDSIVDVTGGSETNPKGITFETNLEDQLKDFEKQDSTKIDTSSRFFRWNAIFGLSSGNPFSHKSLVGEEREDSIDDTVASDSSSDSSSESEFDLDARDEENSLLESSALDDGIPEDVLNSLDAYDDYSDSERTITVIHEKEDAPGELAFEIVSQEEAGIFEEEQEPQSEKNVEIDVNELKSCLDKEFDGLLHQDAEKDMLTAVNMPRVMVTVAKLEELHGRKCKDLHEGVLCGSDVQYDARFGKASVLVLSWSCKNNHRGIWRSSEIIKVINNNNIYVNDIMIPAAVVLTGNNYSKFALLCQALNIKIPGEQSFLNTQKHYIAPTVFDFWKQMSTTCSNVLGNRGLCILGDGRSDSPGHCARYCSYVVMESETGAVLDMKIVDKRETKGISTNMEVYAAEKMIIKLKDMYTLNEIVTDASSSVAKRISDLKGIYPEIQHLFHSFDTWHKSKSISKKLHKIAKIKGNEKLSQWIEDIINHFWYSSEHCNGNLEELKEMWLSMLHHVCGEHKWANGSCKHEEKQDHEKESLRKTSKEMTALREIVLDKRLLKSLQYYTYFRHTSAVENFNSLLLKYVPKRNAFEYPYYITRCYKAGIDHNFHANRKQAKTKSGKPIYMRKYCKRMHSQ